MAIADINDPVFVRRLLGGDVGAFESLVDEMTGVLEAVARKAGVPRADAEDLVLELFYECYRNIRQNKFYPAPTAKLTTYIFRILANKIAQYRRDERKQNEEARQGIRRHSAMGDTATVSYFGEPPERLARLFVGDDASGGNVDAEPSPPQVGGHKFYSLQKLDQDILMWRYFRWSYKEIAEALAPQVAITENALRQRYHRAAEQIGMK